MGFALIFVTILFFGYSFIDPLYVDEQWLQHFPTVIVIPLLFVGVRKKWLSTSSLLCILAFLWLHILGARYIYSSVPYDDWVTVCCGVSVSDWFGWERNHYDRLVHFSFGVFCMLPVFEAVIKHGQLKPYWALFFALQTVLAISALYEVLEWQVAVLMSPEDAESYNGQQGDLWDAQKDMALAFLGSLFPAAWFALKHRCRCRQSTNG